MHSVLNWIVQGSVVALGVFLLMLLLGRSGAATRHLLCVAALAIVVILPFLPDGRAATGSAAPVQSVAQASPGPLMTIPSTWWTSSTAVLVICAAWFAFFSRRVFRASVTVRAARSRCRPFPRSTESQLSHWNTVSGTGRAASLAISPDVASAAVLTGGRPIIGVSPDLLEYLSADELDRVVMHEWSHVQRRDDLVNHFQLAVRAVAGWHPAVWWLHRQLLIEREVACDEIVVALTGSAKEYASSLARVASLAPAGGLSLASVGALSSSALTRRVLRILSRRKTLTHGWAAAALVAAGLVLAFLSLVVAGFHPVGAARSAQPAEPSRISPAAASDMLLDPAAKEEQVSVVRPARRIGSAVRSPRVAAGQPPVPSQPVNVGNGDVEIPDVQSIPEPALVATPLPMAPSTLHAAEMTRQSGPPAPPNATVASNRQQQGSPWAAAADAGAAIGRGSQKAGLATASFFTRIGKKIGNSF